MFFFSNFSASIVWPIHRFQKISIWKYASEIIFNNNFVYRCLKTIYFVYTESFSFFLQTVTHKSQFWTIFLKDHEIWNYALLGTSEIYIIFLIKSNYFPRFYFYKGSYQNKIMNNIFLYLFILSNIESKNCRFYNKFMSFRKVKS